MRKFAAALPLIAGICFGLLGVFIRYFYSTGFNNMAILATRNGVAAILLFAFLFFRDRDLLRCRIRDLPILLGGGFFGMTVTNICFTVSAQKLTLALAGVLIGLSPVYVVLMAAFLFREKLTRRKGTGMFLALIGVVMVSGVMAGNYTFSPSGLLIGILSGFTYGLISILTKLAMRRGYHGLTITFYGILITALTTGPFANWRAVAEFAAQSPFFGSGIMLAHALIGAVIPYLFLNLSLKYIDAGRVSILAESEPVAAMIFGAAFYGEALTVTGVLGMLIAVTAFALISTDKAQGD